MDVLSSLHQYAQKMFPEQKRQGACGQEGWQILPLSFVSPYIFLSSVTALMSVSSVWESYFPHSISIYKVPQSGAVSNRKPPQHTPSCSVSLSWAPAWTLVSAQHLTHFPESRYVWAVSQLWKVPPFQCLCIWRGWLQSCHALLTLLSWRL